jgi:hypothetical protein
VLLHTRLQLADGLRPSRKGDAAPVRVATWKGSLTRAFVGCLRPAASSRLISSSRRPRARSGVHRDKCVRRHGEGSEGP